MLSTSPWFLSLHHYTAEQHEKVSVDFVGDSCSLMADANFSLLTQREWEVATAARAVQVDDISLTPRIESA